MGNFGLTAIMLLIQEQHLPVVEEIDVDNGEGQYGIVLDDPTVDVEREVIKHDLYERLSNEAKDVIRIIFDSPKEICTPVTNQITRRSLYLFVRRKFGKLIAQQIFKQLSSFVKDAYE